MYAREGVNAPASHRSVGSEGPFLDLPGMPTGSSYATLWAGRPTRARQYGFPSLCA